MLALFIVSYFVMSDTNSEGYLHHFSPIIYPVIQVFFGKALLIDLKSLYGFYAYFLQPFLHLFAPTILSLSLLMALIAFVSLISIIFCLLTIIENKLVALLLLPITATAIHLSSKQKTPAHLLGMVLIFCFFLHLTWWINFSIPTSYRHMVVGLFYYFSGLSLLLINIRYENQRRVVLIPILFMYFWHQKWSRVITNFLTASKKPKDCKSSS